MMVAFFSPVLPRDLFIYPQPWLALEIHHRNQSHYLTAHTPAIGCGCCRLSSMAINVYWLSGSVTPPEGVHNVPTSSYLGGAFYPSSAAHREIPPE